MRFALLTAALSLGSISQPGMAAADMSSSAFVQKSTASFAGIGVRISATKKGTLQSTARLRLGLTHFYRDGGAAPSQALQHAPLEIGLSKLGRPDFYISGHRIADLKTRLGLSPLGVGLILSGVAASAVVIGGLAGSESEKEELERRQCFLPEKELCKP